MTIQPAESPGRGRTDFTQQLGRPARFQFFSSVARALLLFAHQLLVARVFGASVLGLFTLATSAAQVAGMLSGLGGDYLILRAGSRKAGEFDAGSAIRGAILPAAAASLLSSLILISAASWTTLLGTDPRISHAVALVAPTVIALSGTALIASVLQATGALRQYTLIQSLLEPVFRLTTLGALALLSSSWAVSLWSFSISTLLTFTMAVALVHAVLGTSVRRHDWLDAFRGLSYSVPVMVSFALQFAMLFVNVAILNRQASAEAAGVFAGAMRLSMLSLWAQMAFSVPFLPLVAGALEQGPTHLRSIYPRMVRFVMLVNVPLLTALFVGRSSLMALFGDNFIVGSTALAWMLIGQVANTATAAIEALLPLGGRPTLGLVNNLFQLLLNALVTWWLVPVLGVTGAGFGVAISVIVTNSLRAHQVQRQWHINPFSPGLVTYMAIGALAVLMWELVLRSALPPFGPILGIAVTGLTGIIVLAFCVAVTRKSDRTVLRQLVFQARPPAANP